MIKKPLPAVKKNAVSLAGYTKFITSLKAKVRSAQIKAAVAVNSELIKLYWEIGKEIVEKQNREGWGSKVLERVAKDLQNEFPGIERFSRTNLFRMKAFYSAYAKVPQLVGQFEQFPVFFIPWGQTQTRISLKIKPKGNFLFEPIPLDEKLFPQRKLSRQF